MLYGLRTSCIYHSHTTCHCARTHNCYTCDSICDKNVSFCDKNVTKLWQKTEVQAAAEVRRPYLSRHIKFKRKKNINYDYNYYYYIIIWWAIFGKKCKKNKYGFSTQKHSTKYLCLKKKRRKKKISLSLKIWWWAWRQEKTRVPQKKNMFFALLHSSSPP